MVFNATFNNVSDISWWSNLLVEGTRVPRENHWPVASHWQILSHNVVFKYTSPWDRFDFTTLVVIGTDCIGSCKFNYHTITTMTAWYFGMGTIYLILPWKQIQQYTSIFCTDTACATINFVYIFSQTLNKIRPWIYAQLIFFITLLYNQFY
jgi:hypothetical protein